MKIEVTDQDHDKGMQIIISDIRRDDVPELLGKFLAVLDDV